MLPTDELVQYIENEAFRGRLVSDILTDVRNAGWQDSMILDAVAQLNEEHKVFEQADIDPLHKKKVHKHSILFILFVTVVTFLCSLVVAGVVREIQKPEFLRFSDPNFTLQLPEDWQPGEDYIAGLREARFYSSEYDGALAVSSELAATLTMYPDTDDDTFGKLLRDGGSGMSILEEKTQSRQGITHRIIAYKGPDEQKKSGIVRGLYVFAQRGQVAMSARIESDASVWERHAEEAVRIANSVTPMCSRESLTRSTNQEKTVFVCGQGS